MVKIYADEDYYSHGGGREVARRGGRVFRHFGVTLADAHKTGLGSSAALVTAFVGAILSHYLSATHFTLETEEGRRVVHNLAQAAHCAAQGKIGSGFDVAAAVYGSCIYRRFSPSLLAELGQPGRHGFGPRLQRLVEAGPWDTEIDPAGAQLQPGLAVVMCDVDCGTATVGMVKQVLAWRQGAATTSGEQWQVLQRCNEALARQLAGGSEAEVTRALEAIRAQMRQMGQAAGVAIEPAEQTQLLDALTTKVAGVLGGVVPGAGGYDAIALVIRDDATTRREIGEVLGEWAGVRMLGVKSEGGMGVMISMISRGMRSDEEDEMASSQ